MAYVIYSETEFESYDGTVHKGDEINVIVDAEDEMALRRWLIQQYVLDGIDVSYCKTGETRRKKISQRDVVGM